MKDLPSEEDRLAAFIMTYNRPEILKGTIESIMGQTRVPEKVLVVDNSESVETRMVVDSFANPAISYYSVGYNSGPAGAARIGLQRLTDEGYKWIFWGDDDDPPHFGDAFEKLFKLIKSNSDKRIGIVGAVGHRFNKYNGELKRVSDDELLSSSEFLEVDSVAGGQCMIINSDVVRLGVIPNEKLFFGFEELDFCIKTQKSGYKILVSTDLFLQSRKKFNKLNYQRDSVLLRKKEALKREYYSVRNIIIILKENGMYVALLNRILKNLVRSVYGFSRGIKYGSENFKFIVIGLLHGLGGKTGKKY